MKDKTKIPKGYYCYTITGPARRGVKVKHCPYWTGKKCSYLNIKIEDDILLEDQCKICEVNMDEEEAR